MPASSRGFWADYKLYLMRAFPGTWAATWISSAVLTIVSASWAAFKPFDSWIMNLLIGAVPATVFVVLMLIWPLRAAHLVHQELENEKDELERKKDAEIAAIKAQADSKIAALEARLKEPRYNPALRQKAACDLAALSHAEETVVREISIHGPISENQLAQLLGERIVIDARLDELFMRTTLLTRNELAQWSIKPSIEKIVKDLFEEADVKKTDA